MNSLWQAQRRSGGRLWQCLRGRWQTKRQCTVLRRGSGDAERNPFLSALPRRRRRQVRHGLLLTGEIQPRADLYHLAEQPVLQPGWGRGQLFSCRPGQSFIRCELIQPAVSGLKISTVHTGDLFCTEPTRQSGGALLPEKCLGTLLTAAEAACQEDGREEHDEEGGTPGYRSAVEHGSVRLTVDRREAAAVVLYGGRVGGIGRARQRPHTPGGRWHTDKGFTPWIRTSGCRFAWTGPH